MWVLEVHVAPKADWSVPYTCYWLTSPSATIGRPTKEGTGGSGPQVDIVISGDSAGAAGRGNSQCTALEMSVKLWIPGEVP